MNDSVSINEISSRLGVTSRTIRFWESEGLFECKRHPYSGHRFVENTMVNKVKLCSELRNIGVSIKDIKRIFESQSLTSVIKVIEENLTTIDVNSQIMENRKSILVMLFNTLKKEKKIVAGSSINFHSFLINLLQENNLKKSQEKNVMNNGLKNEYEIVELPKMRAVYNISVSRSPEDVAMGPVLEWLKEKKLLGISRLFGGNVKPFPKDLKSDYGYGMCASIPADIDVPDHLKEMEIPGGLYALFPSDDDIADSWKKFMKSLKKDDCYRSDRTRLCFEEHIYYGKPGNNGYSFKINLLEPIKDVNQ